MITFHNICAPFDLFIVLAYGTSKHAMIPCKIGTDDMCSRTTSEAWGGVKYVHGIDVCVCVCLPEITAIEAPVISREIWGT